MSNFRKSALALAVLAGLVASGAASAFEVTSSNAVAPAPWTPEGVAYFDIGGNATNIGIWPTSSVVLQSTDYIIGRSTGFALRVTLNNGAWFNNFAVTAGAALPLGWSVAVVPGYAGSNIAIVTFTPAAGAPDIVPGDILDITSSGLFSTELTPTAGTGQILTNLAALASPTPQTVQATYTIYDPVTAQPILAPYSEGVLESGNPVSTTCDPTQGDLSVNGTKIDVGANPTQTAFSFNGAIGANDGYLFQAGMVNIGVNSALGADFSYFNYNTATDNFTTTVSGSFGAFLQAGASVFLSSSPFCGSSEVAGTLNAGGTAATFNYNLAALGGTTSGGSAFLCFALPNTNTTPIAQTAVSVSTSFTRGATTVPGSACALDPMELNAPVVHVYTFNPSGNTTQQSFLRISDTGAVGGKVIITGVDDAGNTAGPVTFTMNAGQSVQLTSTDLQSGNASKGLSGVLGTPVGKWRLTVTSYFPNLVVTSLNRNNNSGTVTNLTNYDVNGKQNAWGVFGDNGN